MFFSCEKDLLLDAILTVQKAASTRSTIPALEGILIRSIKGVLTVSAYDLDLGIVSQVDGQVHKDGEIVINAKMLCEIIRKMPEGMLDISVSDDLIVTIKGGRAKIDLVGINSSEFPELPHIDGEQSFKIKQILLKNMIKQTIFAISQNEAKPAHTGSLFDIKNGMLNLVSVDGYRLAMRTENVIIDSDASFIVPGKTLSEISKIIRDDCEDDADVIVTRKHILFKLGSVSVISRLLEGEFLNYENAIPKNGTIFATVSVRDLTDCVDRTSLLVQEKLKSPVRLKLEFDKGIMSLTCNTALGNAYDEIPCSLEGGDLEIGFNHRYLLDALKACECDEVRLQFVSNLSPCVLTPVDCEGLVMLVLPVRLRG